MTRPEAARRMRLAESLDGPHEPVGDAFAAGDLLPDQAGVIVEAVDALPSDLVDPELVRQAEAELIRLADDYDARSLRRLGRRILDVIAPDVAEAHEARELEREEAAAREATRFTMSDDGHGKCHGRFTLPSAHGAMLRKHLMALASPRRQASADRPLLDQSPPDQALPDRPLSDRPLPRQLGAALCEYVERYPADRLPDAGGVSATIVVTMTVDTLMGGLGAAHLDTGEQLSPGEARRLACEAGIVPIVLGGPSQVLDLGRRRRFHTPTQRIAMAQRDGGCTAEGCDRPPGMCHAHHDPPWSAGNGTSVERGRLLCARHHTIAHHPGYTTTHLPGGRVAFVRRT